MKRSAFLLVAGLLVALPLFSEDTFLPMPAGFSFVGAWDCSGHFARSGKTHHSKIQGNSTPGSGWIELVETDIEPSGYVGRYLIGYDNGSKQVVELDANNSGYAIYNGPGWRDKSLTLTMNDVASYKVPKNRFVFEVVDADHFTMSWEVEKDSAWSAADQLACHRDDGH